MPSASDIMQLLVTTIDLSQKAESENWRNNQNEIDLII